MTTTPIETVKWRDSDNCLLLINQLLLPHQYEVVECRTYRQAGEAIRAMIVRGAPAIGVTAAYAMALAALCSTATDLDQLRTDLQQAAAYLASTRPTAVNLAWALQKCLASLSSFDTIAATQIGLLSLAKTIHAEDIAANRRMGEYGAVVINDGDNVLTHCNAGALATAGEYGTALSAIRIAHEQGKHIHVWVDETRPYLQGARLTAWELMQLGIPCTLITDNMAGHLMSQGRVQIVITGADRVAANGDAANKIGTYMLAVLAKENSVPFYIVAPWSTVDLNIASGAQIPIEERSAEEVTTFGGKRVAPEGVQAAHFAFDVTPARYITGIITDTGITSPDKLRMKDEG